MKPWLVSLAVLLVLPFLSSAPPDFAGITAPSLPPPWPHWRARAGSPGQLTQTLRASQGGEKAKDPPSRWKKIQLWLTDAENRKRFASMGAAGVLSYSVVSNVNYIPLFAGAWYLVSTRTHISPAHQWPVFLSTYATLYFLNNVLRPAKLVVVGFVTPRVNRCFDWVMTKFGIGKKLAVTLTYVILNLGAVLLMGLSVLGASVLAGVPIW
ncbi:unnamed protein product [Symbiodinium sp. CCMP2456]|nr:unnamed protein product [Symbiodinium sp. CCMP2456]